MKAASEMHPPQLPLHPPAVSVQNLCKSYGDKNPILHNICMNVDQGIVYGLLGSSGCGKTTLLSCIVGLKQWESGSVHLYGIGVDGDITHTQGLSKHVGYVPQDLALYDQLSIKETIDYYGKLYGLSGKNIEETWLFHSKLLNLYGYDFRRVTGLSGGEKRRVSLALALIHRPKLLILDEPTVGMDPLLRTSIWNYLHSLSATGKTTIIITTHYIEEVKNSDKVGIMRQGRMLMEDKPQYLMHLYRTDLLEDVVLKICRQDENTRKAGNANQRNAPSSLLTPTPLVITPNLTPRNSTGEILGLSGRFTRRLKEAVLIDNQAITPTSAQEKRESSLIESYKRTVAFSQIVWINFIRHPIFIVLAIFLPVIQLITTGVVVGVEPKGSRVGVINQETPDWINACQLRKKYHSNGSCSLTTLSCNLIKHMSNGGYLELIPYHSKVDAHYEVTRGNLLGYIQIPNNFSKHVVDRGIWKHFAGNETIDGSQIAGWLDLSDFITGFVMTSHMIKSFEAFITELTTWCGFDLKLIEIPILYRQPVYGSMDGSAREYAMPALITAIAFEIAFMITPLILLNEMKQGTLHRSQVAGLQFFEVMTGIILSVTLLAVLQAIVCFFCLEYGLNYSVKGSFLLFMGIYVFTAVGGQLSGIVVGILCQDSLSVILCAIFIVPALTVDIGLLRLLEVIPLAIRYATYLIPPGPAVEPMRSIMNRGLAFTHRTVWPGTVGTLVLCVLYLLLCLILFKRLK